MDAVVRPARPDDRVGMRFDELPADWSDLPLTDPDLAAGVVDLFAREEGRLSREILLLMCDSAGLLVQPACIGGVPRRPGSGRVQEGLQELLRVLGGGRGSVVVALCRPGASREDADDRAWVQELWWAALEEEVPVLGGYLATPGRVRRLADPPGGWARHAG